MCGQFSGELHNNQGPVVDSDGQLDEAAGTLPLMEPEEMFKFTFRVL